MSSAATSKRIFLSPPHMGGEELNFIHQAFEANYIAPVGPQIIAFEEAVAKEVGASHAVALASGTAAIHLTLRTLEIEKGDEILVSSLTFIGSVNPVIYEGAIPVFIDSEASSWNMDAGLLLEEIESCRKRNKLPKAVIAVDLYGQSADIDKIADICGQYGIFLLSDSAEALGALYKNRRVGSTGAGATIFSFNGNKIITTSGGGMVVSEDKKLIDKITFLSQQARDLAPHYEHSQIGFNYRLSNISAAIGLGQIKVLQERVEKKRQIFSYYESRLGNIPGITFAPEAPYGRSTRWLTVCLIEPKEFGATNMDIYNTLQENNIEARPVWKPMHLQKVFTGCRVRGGGISEKIFANGLCLPSGTMLSKQEMDTIIEIILSVRKHFA